MKTEAQKGPVRFGQESAIMEVFVKIIATLVAATLVLFLAMKLTGSVTFQDIRRNFVTTPDVESVPADGTTNFSTPPQQKEPPPSTPPSTR